LVDALLVFDVLAAQRRLLQRAANLFDQIHRPADGGDRLGRSSERGVAVRFELVKLDERVDTTDALGLRYRLLEFRGGGSGLVAGQSDLTRRRQDLELDLDETDEAGVLAGVRERGLGGVLVSECELRLGQQRQAIGRVTPAVVDRPGGYAGRRRAHEVLGQRRRLLSLVTRRRVGVVLIGDLGEQLEQSRDPHRGASVTGRNAGSRVAQALLVPFARLDTIAG